MRRNELYRGKPRGYYDPSPEEMFFVELGQEIFKETENKLHKTMMADEEWNLYCDTAIKCVRVGTVWGPKRIEDVIFEMTIHAPYKVEKTGSNEEDIKNITLKINQVIEKMILKNPKQGIWSHNRWK